MEKKPENVSFRYTIITLRISRIKNGRNSNLKNKKTEILATVNSLRLLSYLSGNYEVISGKGKEILKYASCGNPEEKSYQR